MSCHVGLPQMISLIYGSFSLLLSCSGTMRAVHAAGNRGVGQLLESRLYFPLGLGFKGKHIFSF